MLLWIFIIIFAIGLILYGLSEISWNDKFRNDKHFDRIRDYSDTIDTIGKILAILGGFVSALLLLIIFLNYVNLDAQVAVEQEEYKVLVYKVESNACRDEFGFLNKEIIEEVAEWNKDIVYKKLVQRNFWIGIFYPNIYDQFELIDYENFVK